MKIGLPRFTWGDKPVEEKPQPNPDTILHEPAYIVMKMGSGEITSRDQEYVAQNLDSMLVDEALQEAWSRVHIGQPIFPYKAALRNVAAEWNRTHPNYAAEPYYVLNKKYVVVPTSSGVQVYEVKKVKNRGKPDETVDLDKQDPWLVFPNISTKADVERLIFNQIREDQQIDRTNKIREILGEKN